MAHSLIDKPTQQFVQHLSNDYQQRSLRSFLSWPRGYISPDNLDLFLKFAALSLLFATWWAITHYGLVNPRLIPPPNDVFHATLALWGQGSLSQNIAISFIRASTGFGLAVLVSLPLGIMLGLLPHLQIWFTPITAIFRYLLTLTLIFLFILYLDGNELTKISLIFIGTVGYNLVRITEVVRGVPRALIETCYTLGGNLHQMIFQVVLPYTWPRIIEIFRLNVAISWSLVMVTELLAPKIGLGQGLLAAASTLAPSEFWAYFLILGGLGLAIDLFFRWAWWTTCEWSLD